VITLNLRQKAKTGPTSNLSIMSLNSTMACSKSNSVSNLTVVLGLAGRPGSVVDGGLLDLKGQEIGR